MRIFTLILLFALAPLANASIILSKTFVSLSTAAGGGIGTSDSVYVRNSGEVTRISVYNGCFSDFSVSHSCFGSLNPNGSCSIQVRFTPRNRGHQSCSITVNSSQGGSRTINVSGNGY